ncbi:MAG: NTP transferase domain-containing protein [Candidatus Lokiarchaeota archaeon]|nr:NTP transferase domain-containing protein [Candidatus Lokiarchaeota archaeon]
MGTPLSPQENEQIDELCVIILCAGKGTRFGEKTLSKPKPLITSNRLHGKPILYHTLNSLQTSSINNIIIITGYLGDQIKKYVSSLKSSFELEDLNITVFDSEGEYKKGPFYSFLSILKTENIIKRYPLFLIIPGDTIFTYKLFNYLIRFIFQKRVSLIENPIIFYYPINIHSKITKSQFPTIKIKSDNKKYLDTIEIKRNSEMTTGKTINLLYPVVLFPSWFIGEIDKIKESFQGKTIREWLNYYTELGGNILIHKLPRLFYFVDIDSEEDLQLLRKK